jgi:hypothetical protein
LEERICTIDDDLGSTAGSEVGTTSVSFSFLPNEHGKIEVRGEEDRTWPSEELERGSSRSLDQLNAVIYEIHEELNLLSFNVQLSEVRKRPGDIPVGGRPQRRNGKEARTQIKRGSGLVIQNHVARPVTKRERDRSLQQVRRHSSCGSVEISSLKSEPALVLLNLTKRGDSCIGSTNNKRRL